MQFIAKSLQQMALQGFIGPFEVWGYAALAAVILGILLMFMAVTTKKEDKPDAKWLVNLREKLSAKYKYDKALGYMGLRLVIGGYAFLFFIVIPLIIWAIFAYSSGKNLFEDEVCKLRSGKNHTTKISLKDGKVITERIIDRSENLIALSDGVSLHVFSKGENPSLAYSISLPQSLCPK